MKTKALMIGTVLVATGLILAGVSWAGSRFAYNQAKQHNRITAGVKKGTITGGELARLNREQGRIQKTIWRARSDGRLSPGERHHVYELQHKASKHIYRAKHNPVVHYKSGSYYRHTYYGYPYRYRTIYYGYPYKYRYYGYPYRHRRLHYSFSFSMGWR
jgi:hypothetical protein